MSFDSSASDVIVVGAGAAGLSAAAHLARHGVHVTLLEARDRIGGRMWTIHPEGLMVPVELGAEFMHGRAPELETVVREARLRAVDIGGRRWTSAGGRLRPVDDFWERLDRPMRRLHADRRRDRSFADAIRHMRGITPADRALATGYVEGFHAADLTRISERSLAEGGSPRRDVRERRGGRVLEGYGAVVHALAAPILGRLRLGVSVTRVRWRRGRVAVEARGQDGNELPPMTARAVIVTVPLAVLQSTGVVGAIEFDPPLHRLTRTAATGLLMGHVVRVALQLDRPFWMEEPFARRAGDERFDTMSFVQALEPVPFPVWWTSYPVQAPLLVGWHGGPTSLFLSGRPQDEMVTTAVASLATILGMTPRAVRRHVVAAFTHDWSRDPFSRGAYSYAAVGGDMAFKQLARPEQDTVFLAGEHADAEGRNGTVHGAIGSGARAAGRFLRVMERAARSAARKSRRTK